MWSLTKLCPEGRRFMVDRKFLWLPMDPAEALDAHFEKFHPYMSRKVNLGDA